MEACAIVSHMGKRNWERPETAAGLRAQGKTFREVGSVLGVSSARAAQLVESWQRRQTEPDFVSVRAMNALVNLGIEITDQTDPDTVRDKVREKFLVDLYPLLHCKNCGDKTIVEICNWAGIDLPERLTNK